MLIVIGILLLAVSVWLMADCRTMSWQEKVDKLKRLGELGMVGRTIGCFFLGLLCISLGAHVSYRGASQTWIAENRRLTSERQSLENKIASLEGEVILLQSQIKEEPQPAKEPVVEEKWWQPKPGQDYELYTNAERDTAEKWIESALVNVRCDNVLIGEEHRFDDLGLIGTLDVDVYCDPVQKTTIGEEARRLFFERFPHVNKVRVTVSNYRTGGAGVDSDSWIFDKP